MRKWENSCEIRDIGELAISSIPSYDLAKKNISENERMYIYIRRNERENGRNRREITYSIAIQIYRGYIFGRAKEKRGDVVDANDFAVRARARKFRQYNNGINGPVYQLLRRSPINIERIFFPLRFVNIHFYIYLHRFAFAIDDPRERPREWLLKSRTES